MEKPKVGVLLLTAEWFAQLGASGGSFQGLPQMLDEDAAAMERALGRELEIVSPGVLATPEQVDRALLVFRERDVDAVIACQITWGEDRLILKTVRELPDVPLLLWCYTPYTRLPEQMTMRDLFRASGPVGGWGLYSASLRCSWFTSGRFIRNDPLVTAISRLWPNSSLLTSMSPSDSRSTKA